MKLLTPIGAVVVLLGGCVSMTAAGSGPAAPVALPARSSAIE